LQLSARKVALSPPTNVTRNVTRNVARGVARNVTRNVARNVGRNVTRNVAKNVAKNVARNVARNMARNVTATHAGSRVRCHGAQPVDPTRHPPLLRCTQHQLLCQPLRLGVPRRCRRWRADCGLGLDDDAVLGDRVVLGADVVAAQHRRR
jgi:hypothetical protein